MNPQTPVRKPFVEPVVSEPIDALDATRTFGGMLGQVIFAPSSGAALDDGDICAGTGYDPTYVDSGADPPSCS
jgi:hypothetical protein